MEKYIPIINTRGKEIRGIISMMHCQYFETGVYKYDRRNLFAVPRKRATINHTKETSMRAGVKSSCSLVKKKTDGLVKGTIRLCFLLLVVTLRIKKIRIPNYPFP